MPSSSLTGVSAGQGQDGGLVMATEGWPGWDGAMVMVLPAMWQVLCYDFAVLGISPNIYGGILLHLISRMREQS